MIDWTLMADWVQAVVGVLTLPVIVWYTNEARRQRQTAVNQLSEQIAQTDLQIRPMVVVYLDATERTVTLHNVGNGTALNVRIPEVPVHERIDGWPITLEFPEGVAVLEAGKRTMIPYRDLAGGQDFDGMFAAAGDSRYTRDKVSIRVEYEDVLMRPLESITEIGPGSHRIIGPLHDRSSLPSGTFERQQLPTPNAPNFPQRSHT
ncbi:MAG: hypothetical protein JWM27_1120 [Gemmatimonadetes bacterium]|nr:hypothetical protein [Gemmatimonadota bacterium]